jgi:hypothetical protein
MTDWESQVLEFIRGDRDELDPAGMGITVVVTDASVALHEPAGVPSVTPTLADVATGLVVQYARSLDLQDWARLVLAAGFIDLSALESDDSGHVILEALWWASEGAPLPPETIRVIEAAASASS